MDFGFTDRMRELHGQVREFMDSVVIPNAVSYTHLTLPTKA